MFEASGHSGACQAEHSKTRRARRTTPTSTYTSLQFVHATKREGLCRLPRPFLAATPRRFAPLGVVFFFFFCRTPSPPELSRKACLPRAWSLFLSPTSSRYTCTSGCRGGAHPHRACGGRKRAPFPPATQAVFGWGQGMTSHPQRPFRKVALPLHRGQFYYINFLGFSFLCRRGHFFSLFPLTSTSSAHLAIVPILPRSRSWALQISQTSLPSPCDEGSKRRRTRREGELQCGTREVWGEGGRNGTRAREVEPRHGGGRGQRRQHIARQASRRWVGP